MLELNEIYNTDFFEGVKSLPDNSVDLIIADPPYYNIKGDFDFKLTFDEWKLLQKRMAEEFKRVLKLNGSILLYGHARNIAYQQVIFDELFFLENNLVWHKTDCQTRKNIKGYRCFAPVTERILFYSNEYRKNNNSLVNPMYKEYVEVLTPIIEYFMQEKEKIMKLKCLSTNGEFIRFMDEYTGSTTAARHYFSWSQWMFPSEKTYAKLQKIGNGVLEKEYPLFKKQYSELKTEFERTRRYFVNSEHTDVLLFSQESHITRKYNHPTQKPPKLTKMLIESTTKPESLVLIPFAGSGVECACCKELQRNFIGFEIDEKYYEVSRNRINEV
ncbi:site-specific DNA-methyltransferase (adenine-specific) [Methanococcus maripaludis]|uniref:Type II methyltransferase n=1 Tax=Methanococcus maripaludis TaxID=39152 RepID=A0A7J9P272_METMI|nr:site-specific DNA-methyltransferase [Methanococcus maripaludis]MBA2853473.1 site-specific DNA-methyltransferase (adenine-specific) [Methanococcus maripaludis]